MPLNEIFLTIFVRMCLGHSGRLTFRPLVRSFENSHPFFSLMQNSSSNKANKQNNIPFFTWLLINIKGKYKIDPLVFMWNWYFPENSTNRLFTHKEICRNFAVSRLSRRRKGNVWTLTLMLFDEGFVISCIYLSLWWKLLWCNRADDRQNNNLFFAFTLKVAYYELISWIILSI